MNYYSLYYGLHIGTIIKSVASRKSVSVKQLAKALGCDRGTVYNIYKSQSIDMTRLLIISDFLNYDFIGLIYHRRFSFSGKEKLGVYVNSVLVKELEVDQCQAIDIHIKSID